MRLLLRFCKPNCAMVSELLNNQLIDAKKMKRFNNIKSAAGSDTQTLSFNLILTIKPLNISSVSPNDATTNSGLYMKPINNPEAPKNSKIIVNKPNFSKLNLLNSSFICGDMK